MHSGVACSMLPEVGDRISLDAKAATESHQETSGGLCEQALEPFRARTGPPATSETSAIRAARGTELPA